MSKLDLSTNFQTTDENELKSIFLLTFVSQLWAYGDKGGKDFTGCVLNNRITGTINEKDATISHYLNSPIGCCADYTKVLKILLDKAKITNRIGHIFGHVFNEAIIKGKWRVLDANINTIFYDSWENMFHRAPGDKIYLTTFVHKNMIHTFADTYRQVVGSFRMQIIHSALVRSNPVIYRNSL